MIVSRFVRNLAWLTLIVLCAGLYLGLDFAFGLGAPWLVLGGRQLRALLPTLALFVAVGDVLLLLCVSNDDETPKGKVSVVTPVSATEPEDAAEYMPVVEVAGSRPCKLKQPEATEVPISASEMTNCPPASAVAGDQGAELFAQACALPHHEVPDFGYGTQFFNLLGQSAAAGHAPACSRLGELAMSREAWVEAYYWMKRAKVYGMCGLEPVLREIRTRWKKAGSPNEIENVYRFFSVIEGSVGRALLDLDSGREAKTARDYLASNWPEFLE